MSRILVLAKSGFGKTFSMGQVPELNHIGLDPKETYVISVTSKPLTFPKSRELYKVAEKGKVATGNRYISNNPEETATLLEQLLQSPYKNIVVDDFNYLMQDYYMDNALKGGWDKMCVPAKSKLCENNWIKTVKGIEYLNIYLYICQPKIYKYEKLKKKKKRTQK